MDDREIQRKEISEKQTHRGKSGFLYGYMIGMGSVIVLLLIGLLIVRFYIGNSLGIRESLNAMQKIQLLTSYLDEKCLAETSNEELLNGAYAGLVNAVDDKYTRYYTQEEYEEYMEGIHGSYAGIGVSVQWDTQKEMLQIVDIVEKGPAEKAGLCIGDLVYAVNGTVVQGMPEDDTISLIKGEENTEVHITILRDGAEIDKTLVREVIVEQTVFYQMAEQEIGYIQLTAFNEASTQQFLDALEALKEQGMQGLILDLRDNPGGRLQTAIDIADALLPEGTITYTEDKQGNQRIYSSDEECLNIPMAVLVNSNSASASEILTGAIQDYKAGTIIGSTTFGKGIVQSTYRLPDGSAIKMTMARYYTPSGSYIHGQGIEPNIAIDIAKGTTLGEVFLTDEDIPFQTALEAVRTMIHE